MNDVRLVLSETRWEHLSFWRNPASAVFTAAFPIMFLLIFGSWLGGQRIGFLGGVRFVQYYVPAIVAFSLVSSCYTALAMQVSTRRDMGLLKRMRATPLPAWLLVTSLILNALIVGLLVSALVVAIGVGFFDVQVFWSRLWAFAVVYLLGGLCLAALGILVATLVPNADAAPAIVNFLLFPVLFLSGTFFAIDPTSLLARVMQWLPLRPFTLSMFRVFDPRGGTLVSGRELAVLAGWGVLAAALAVRRFRWEPRRT